MGCEVQKGPEGSTVIYCGRGVRKSCRWCNNPGIKLCDFVLTSGKRRHFTCDAPCCIVHAENVGEDEDFCPDHWTEKKKREALSLG